jgi:hypothetical protein
MQKLIDDLLIFSRVSAEARIQAHDCNQVLTRC